MESETRERRLKQRYSKLVRNEGKTRRQLAARIGVIRWSRSARCLRAKEEEEWFVTGGIHYERQVRSSVTTTQEENKTGRVMRDFSFFHSLLKKITRSSATKRTRLLTAQQPSLSHRRTSRDAKSNCHLVRSTRAHRDFPQRSTRSADDSRVDTSRTAKAFSSSSSSNGKERRSRYDQHCAREREREAERQKRVSPAPLFSCNNRREPEQQRTINKYMHMDIHENDFTR